jgi:DNA polymerase III delta prime subunit
MKIKNDEYLWTEKYRPQIIEDCILTPHLKKLFLDIVKNGNFQNLLLCGGSGSGKSTVARALCEELELDYIFINGSEESGIDTLRNRVTHFASAFTLLSNDKPKVVIFDEADNMPANSTQVALRAFIEEFSKNCRFIFTCNFKNRIIEPLHSRCAVIDFAVSKKDIVELSTKFFKKLKFILNNENIEYDEKVLVDLIVKHAPDWRRVINECQRHSSSGKISPDILLTLTDTKISQLISYLKEKNFKQMRAWVAEHGDLDTTAILRAIYDNMIEYLQPHSIPQAVILLADYNYKSVFTPDRELNLAACLTELMASLEWK